MSLISMSGAWLSFSDAPLLDNTEIHIEDNERVCLVGRNGAGKSTLLKILGKEIPLDDGRVIYEQDLIVAISAGQYSISWPKAWPSRRNT